MDKPIPKPEETTESSEETSGSTPAVKPETGGPKGLEPTRYGDWERNGRCYDF